MRERASSAPELIVGDDQVVDDFADETDAGVPSDTTQEADVGEQLAQVLSDAASFRRVRLYAKAVETLRIGLEIEPRSLDVREMLRDVLLEAGHVDEAVLEMLDLAALYVDSLDGDSAARCLQDVLAYDPPNLRARAMLHELGYEVIDDPGAAGAGAPEAQDLAPEYASSDPEVVAAPLPARDEPGYAEEAPLPAYELEELAPSEPPPARAAYPDRAQPRPASPPASAGRPAPARAQRELDDIDDPFGGGEPLPSFPWRRGRRARPRSIWSNGTALRRRTSRSTTISSRGTRRPIRNSSTRSRRRRRTKRRPPRRPLLPLRRPPRRHLQPRAPPRRPPHAPPRLALPVAARAAAAPAPAAPAPAAPAAARAPAPPPAAVEPPPPPSPELEEALEEAEFFASRGLFDDAKNILLEQLERLPKHPLLRERLAELEAQEREVKRGSGTRERPSQAEPLDLDADRAFDIAASLDALEQGDRDGGGAAFQEPDEQVDVEEVFAKFKEGVAKQISVDDGQSHYDLGVAYKEMGLLDDAIREFDVAARDPKRECVCRSMIGMIQIERGNINEAIDALMRGLKAKVRTPDQDTVLEFEVAACYEQKKANAKALEFYQKAARRDPDYRDVQDRIRRLKGEQKPAMRVAVGADEEFDRAFDDLLSGGKP